MIYFKGILFTVLNFGIVFFQCTAFGLYGFTSDSIESEINLNFEPEASFGVNLDETYTPALLFNDNGEYCVISLSEQDMKRLNTQKILKQNLLENNFAFEQMEDLESCQSETAQLVLDSIGKQANQLAIAQSAVAAVVIYIGACATADHVTTKKAKARGRYAGGPGFGETMQVAVGIMCFPIYGVSTLIRWYNGDTSLDWND